MMGHNVLCDVCVGRFRNCAEGEEDGFDRPAPKDQLCRVCRKAVRDAYEQRQYLRRLGGADVVVGQVEKDMMHGRRSRWRILTKTSPSGKTLFVCLSCGRVTPGPTPNCPEPVKMWNNAMRDCSDWKPSEFEVQ